MEEPAQLDLTQLVERAIHPFGRYQKFIIFTLCINSAIVGINNIVPAFHVYTPENYRCADEGFEGNLTCVTGCKTYKFEGIDTSVVTEWSLVCDRRYLSAMVNTIYFIGVTISSVVGGVMADKFGRRKVILICLYVQGICGASLCLTHSLWMWIGLRFMQGLFISGLQYCSYSLMQELTPTRKLTFTSLLWAVARGIGLIYLGAASYWVRDWRMLQLVLSIPTAITLAWFWLIPESPKWYLTHDRTSELLVQITAISRRNKDKAFASAYQLSGITVSPRQKKTESSASILDLFTNRILLKHIAVMTFVAFTTTLSYYVVLLYTPYLPGDRHLNFIIGSFIEIAGFILVYFMLSSCFGRRLTLIIFQYTIALFCLAFGILPFFENSGIWVATVALLGKGVSSATVTAMQVHTAELFPTIVRASAAGLCGFSSRTGSLASPLIVLLGDVTHSVVPIVIATVLLFLSGSATFFVPETHNKNLLNTIAEVEETWGKSKKRTSIKIES